MVAMLGCGCKCGIGKDGLCIITKPGMNLPEGIQDIGQCVRNIQIDIPIDDLVIAKVEMFLDLKRIEVAGRYQIFVEDPFTKKEKEVQEIKFKDGTVLNMEKGSLSK